jgi:hypothetical protein
LAPSSAEHIISMPCPEKPSIHVAYVILMIHFQNSCTSLCPRFSVTRNCKLYIQRLCI